MKTPLPLYFCALLACAVGAAHAESILVFEKKDAVYTASADGRNPKKICAGNHPNISPDGRFVVYTVTTKEPAKKDGGAPFSRALRVRELATGSDHVLPTADAKQVDAAQWSPDGRWIAFEILQEHWQVAVIKPDGSGLHILTDKLENPRGNDHFLAGWNLQQNALLAEDLTTLTQISPAGEVAWRKPLDAAIGGDATGSDMHCTISADGKTLVTTHQAVDDEFKNLDGPSAYLVSLPLPDGKAERLTPKVFDVYSPWVDPKGEFVLFRGFGQKDVTTSKHSDGVKLSYRIYRFNLRTKAMVPLVEGGDYPSMSLPE